MGSHHHFQPRPAPQSWRWLALTLVVAAFAMPSTALAQSPTDAEYTPANAQIAPRDPCTGPNAGSLTQCQTAKVHTIGSGLPFTGLDLGVLALAAAGLLGSGVVLRRLSEPNRQTS